MASQQNSYDFYRPSSSDFYIPYRPPETRYSPEKRDNAFTTTISKSVFLPTPHKTRVLEFANPVDLDDLPAHEKAKKHFFQSKSEISYRYDEMPSQHEEIKYYEPKISYRVLKTEPPVENKPMTVMVIEKAPEIKPGDYNYRGTYSSLAMQEGEKIEPYDYREYRPLDFTYRVPREETTKKAHLHFREGKPEDVEIPSRIVTKLDLVKDDIGYIKQKLSLSPERKSPRPRIFDEPKTNDFMRYELKSSTPIHLHKAEHIKRSGYKATPNSSRKTSSKLIFSPMSVIDPPPDTKSLIKSLESPRLIMVSQDRDPLYRSYEFPRPEVFKPEISVSEAPKRHAPPRVDFIQETTKRSSPITYQRSLGSRDVVVPSRNPIMTNEQENGGLLVSSYPFATQQTVNLVETTREIKREKQTEENERIFCIDCEQYVRVGNANLHSMFCYKNLERSGHSREDVRSRLRNILFFLCDDLDRMKKKSVAVDPGFWSTSEELKRCLIDIIECKSESDIHAHINRLRLLNERLDSFQGMGPSEVRKLGLKAEEDLTS